MELSPDDRALRELRAARSWGVSWRRFCGWEPVTVQEYTYDECGRIKTITTRQLESEWTDDEREAALALLDYEADLCPGCNHPMSETTDPANEYAYEAGLPIRCHRCTRIEMARTQYEDSPQPSALFMTVGLKDRSQDA